MSTATSTSRPRILGMKADLYHAASKGNLAVIREYLESGQRDYLYTVTGNNFLHVYVTDASRSCTAAKKASDLVSLKPDMLHELNGNEESALHLAAERGNTDVARELIALDTQGELLGKGNKDGHTALHCAARYNKVNVAALLLTTNPALASISNVQGQTALFMASERGHLDVVKEILKMGAPDSSALFVALSNKRQEVATLLLEKCPSLAQEQRESSQLEYPLHLAASMRLLGVVQQLLLVDASTAYLQDSEGRTPLHYAASNGFMDIMETILTLSPDCWELVDSKRRNFLHTAAESCGKFGHIEDIVKFGQNKLCGTKHLLSDRDEDGRTPLQILEHSEWDTKLILHDDRVDKMACNMDNVVQKKAKEEGPQELKDLNLVVVGILAAETYAGFGSVPGGFDILGLATFHWWTPYHVFALANGACFYLSLLSLVLHMFLLTSKKWKKTPILVEVVLSYTILAILAFSIAATAQLYMLEVSFMLFVKFSVAAACIFIETTVLVIVVDPLSFVRLILIMTSPLRAIVWVIFRRGRLEEA